MRLIDADALLLEVKDEIKYLRENNEAEDARGLSVARSIIRSAPTVVQLDAVGDKPVHTCQSKWISVNDMLPPENISPCKVLFYYALECRVGWYDHRRKRWHIVAEYPLDPGKVTHWMFQPEPPQ